MRIKLGAPIKPSELCSLFGSPIPAFDAPISFISTDSRTALNGDLFVALPGEHASGEEYVGEAIEKGAIPLTVSRSAPGIHVKDVREAMLRMAEHHISKLRQLKHRICITGSVGKTTTKEFLSALLGTTYRTHSTYQNFNNALGASLTVLQAPEDTEALVLELGSNHHGEISFLSSFLHPSLSLITNIGTSHIGNLGSKELIAREKLGILDGMSKPRLICEYGETLFNVIKEKITVSCECRSADFYLLPIKEDIDGTTFDLFSGKEIISNLRFSIPGRHMLASLAMAIAASVDVGISQEKIRAGVGMLGNEHIRHRLLKMEDYIIFDDSYNASRESILADFKLLELYRGRPRSALIGDVLELGGKTEDIHREIGACARRYGFERLYLFGAYSMFTALGAIESGMPEDRIFINSDLNDPALTAKQICMNHEPGEIILFKASHRVNLKRVIDILSTTRGESYDR